MNAGKTGEKNPDRTLRISGSPLRFFYNTMNRLATLLGLSKKSKNTHEIAHELAMQVAAMNQLPLIKKMFRRNH